MLQTLFHLPLSWLWTLWAIGSCVGLAWLTHREGFTAAARACLPVIVTLGLILGFIVPALCDRDGLAIRGYGVMLLLGLLSGVGMAMYRARRMGQDPEMIQSLAFWLVLAGIVGARCFYVIEYWHEYQRPTLLETVKAIADFTKGGLVVFGSAIGAGLALLAFVRTYRLPGLALADLVAPSMMIGLAFGRVGCFLNGCCFGGQCDLSWAVRFPPASPPHIVQAREGKISLFGLVLDADRPGQAVIKRVEPNSPSDQAGLTPGQHVTKVVVNDQPYSVATIDEALFAIEQAHHKGDQIAIYTAERSFPAAWTVAVPPDKSLPLHPVQLYAAADALLLCLLLLAYYPYRRRDGEVFALMITIHPISRFLQEVIRIDEAGVFGTGLSISQNLSILMLAAAIGLWIYLRGQPRGSVWPATCPP
ncbi:MAG TPA: prolipoprotein diacylglyceryl transferase family protein [Pirellulales bacterium]|nr:prolipoprotein diacylglyceryl transferase family protein [Pirellulales bacterium]